MSEYGYTPTGELCTKEGRSAVDEVYRYMKIRFNVELQWEGPLGVWVARATPHLYDQNNPHRIMPCWQESDPDKKEAIRKAIEGLGGF